MTAYRQECLKREVASCEHVHVVADLSIAADVSRTLADARAGAGPLLVLTEGLLIYLTPSQVSSLAKQLRLEAQAQWWLADLISPLLRKAMGTIWRSQLGSAQAAFEFAPQDKRVFFDAVGWQEHEFHSTRLNAIGLGRFPPHGAAWNALWKWTAPAAQEALKRMSGVALFRRAP